MTTVFLSDSFDSAHFLPNVPDGHKCKNLHGHTYHVTLFVHGPVDPESGWVIDYAVIKTYWETVKKDIDHKFINDLVPNSTCELVAAYIWKRLKAYLPGLSCIELQETAHCGVIYRGE